MTELEWRKGSDPLALLASLPFWRSRGRRRRLILCGLCRLLWDALPDETSRRWVEEAERYADGCIPLKDLSKLAPSDQSAWKRDMTLTSIRDPQLLRAVALGARNPSTVHIPLSTNHGWLLCFLVREIFGNPYQVMAFDSDWLSSTVIDLARTIYEDHAFERMPILADALMDAGCDNADILDHCRYSTPHVRGCWVIDLILDKK